MTSRRSFSKELVWPLTNRSDRGRELSHHALGVSGKRRQGRRAVRARPDLINALLGGIITQSNWGHVVRRLRRSVGGTVQLLSQEAFTDRFFRSRFQILRSLYRDLLQSRVGTGNLTEGLMQEFNVLTSFSTPIQPNSRTKIRASQCAFPVQVVGAGHVGLSDAEN